MAVKDMTREDILEKIKNKRLVIKYQSDQAFKSGLVTCGCHNSFNLINMHKCLYCGELYCKDCAEIHFGKTKKEYDVERGFSYVTGKIYGKIYEEEEGG